MQPATREAELKSCSIQMEVSSCVCTQTNYKEKAYFSQHVLISTSGNLARLKSIPAPALWNLMFTLTCILLVASHFRGSHLVTAHQPPVLFGGVLVLFSSIVFQELVTQRPHPQLRLFILKLSQRNQMLWRSACFFLVSLETSMFGGHLEDETWKRLGFLSLC